MFASSQYPMEAPARAQRSHPVCAAGEGHDCEACRRATQALLLPESRPSGWLLLLAGSCMYVVIQAFALRLA